MTPVLTIAALVVAVLAVAIAIAFVASYRTGLRLERARTANWKSEAEKATTERRKIGRALAEKVDECHRLTDGLAAARAELAKFTGPRVRGADGRFLGRAA